MAQSQAQRMPFDRPLLDNQAYDGVFRMVEEAVQERERMAFLHGVLTNASGKLDVAEMLTGLEGDLNDLGQDIQLRGLAAIFWETGLESGNRAQVFVRDGLATKYQERLRQTLLKRGSALSGRGLLNDEFKEFQGNVAVWASRTAALVPARLDAGHGLFGLVLIQLAKPALPRLRKILRAAVEQLARPFSAAIAYGRMREQADLDGLTGLYGRRAFDRRLMEEMKRHQRLTGSLTLLLLDLDHFKRVNDTYGHPAGDAVLRTLGKLLGHGLRATDFAARYGGEEFALILPHTKACHGRTLAERIRDRIEAASFTWEGQEIPVTASIGMASLCPSALGRTKDLLEMADKALYRAKAAGRNRVSVYECEAEESAGPA